MQHQTDNQILQQILSQLTDIKVVLGRQAEQLSEHMRRSDAIERRVEQVDAEVKPIQRHVTSMQALAKATLFVCKVLGAVVAFLAIAKVFSSIV